MKTFFHKMLIIGKMEPIYHHKIGNKLANIAVQHPIKVKKNIKINWWLVGKLPMENWGQRGAEDSNKDRPAQVCT
jgi:hypothetical protein